MTCPAGCTTPIPPFPLFFRRPNGLSVCQSNLIHTLDRSSVGWNEGASQSPPDQTCFAQAVTSTSRSQLSPFCDTLATLVRVCIALPVWSAVHSDPPAVTPCFIQGSILSHIQTVCIATSEITALSWFLPFNLLLFPLGSQPCTDTAFSRVSVPYWCVCCLVPAPTPDCLTSVCVYPRTSTQ